MTQTVVKPDSLREVFGQALCDLAHPDTPNFYVLGVDLSGGVGSWRFRAKYPDRHIELGIAEQGATAVAAGLAISTGLPIFLPGFATFLLRGLEPARLSIFHDRRNVKLVMSHLGLSAGPDGSSVQEMSYIATWRSIPGSVVVWPADAIELRQVMEWALGYDGPVVIFTGRNPAPPVISEDYQFRIGEAQVIGGTISKVADVTLIACGHTVSNCMRAAEILGSSNYGIGVRVCNLSTLKPVDTVFLSDLQATTRMIFTVEDHNLYGGLFGAVAEALAPRASRTPIIPIAVFDVFGESGEPGELYSKYGLGAGEIVKRVLEGLS